jgi:hypothetical protein
VTRHARRWLLPAVAALALGAPAAAAGAAARFERLLVDRHTTYAHNDPNSASPKNDFVRFLLPFLAKIGSR